MELDFKTLVEFIIVALVVVFILIFAFPNIWKEAQAFLGFGQQENIKKDLNNLRSDLFVSMINGVKTCFDNGDSGCYCTLTNTFVPSSTLVEFANSNDGLHASFYRDVVFSNCEIKKEGTLVQQEVMSGKSFYVENSYGLFSGGLPSVSDKGIITSSQYAVGQSAYVSSSNLCSTKDVAGKDTIDFTNGVLYKVDVNSILFTRKQDSLRPCAVKKSQPLVAAN